VAVLARVVWQLIKWLTTFVSFFTHPAGLDIVFLFNKPLFYIYFSLSITREPDTLMLPNHPSPSRSRAGLPTAPRSRSVGRARQDELSNSYSREQSSRTNGALSSRQVRSPRSMASMPPVQNRYDTPPMPQPRQAFRPNNFSRAYESPSMVRKESDSSSSMSSTASSFLDRLRGGGDTSSNTSLEEDYDLPKRRPGQESKLTRQDSRSYEGMFRPFICCYADISYCTPNFRKP
jgi:hypothetical protein